MLLLRLVLTGILAEASHRLVENRFRHGSPRVAPARLRRPVLVAGGAVATVALAVLGLVVLPTTAPTTDIALAMSAAQSDDDATASTAPASVTGDARGPTPALPTPAATAVAVPEPTAESSAEPSAAASPSPTAAPPDSEDSADEDIGDEEGGGRLRVTAVGDSVMAGAVQELADAIPGREIVDADVARTVDDVAAVVQWHAREGSLARDVVIHTGNNGLLPAGFVDQVMDAAGPDRDVWFLTVRVPRSWEDDVNAVLQDDVPDHDNAHLLDWYALSNEQYDWFAGDGVHIIDAPGAEHYAEMVAEAVA